MDVSDPLLYEENTFHPMFKALRSTDPVHYCEESRYGLIGLSRVMTTSSLLT